MPRRAIEQEAPTSKSVRFKWREYVTPRGFRIQAYENDIQILKLCVKYGVEIMLGSDAHREEDAGDFTRTEKILKEVDFPEELIVNRSLSYVKNRLRV